MIGFTAKDDPGEKISYGGKASARTSTSEVDDVSAAKIEAMQETGVTMTLESKARKGPATVKYPGLGPGGLGCTEKIRYWITGAELEYKTSDRADKQADCRVTLKRVEGAE